MADFEDNNPFEGSESNDGHMPEFDHLSVASPKPSDGESDRRDSAESGTARVSKTYSSKVEQILDEHPEIEIVIVDASKSHEGNSRGFIAYTIKIQDLTVRRRYSEFESLRATLSKLFPTLVIPPIPEKHTMSDYAAAPTKAKEDATIIEHRQRMLAVFLNRCKAMDEIRSCAVFQRFLDSNSSWQEVLNSPPVSQLPKNVLKAPPIHPETASLAHSYLPVPSSSTRLKSNSPQFDEIEQNAKEYEAIIANGLEKVNRRIIKRYSDKAADFSELGARFNAFSLEEHGSLASAIERVGQAIDNTYITTEALVAALGASFSEPLGESAQFASAVRSVLKYRRQKAIQQELTADTLVHKKANLETLERQELEAQRINQYLNHHQPEAPESPSAAAAAAAAAAEDQSPPRTSTDSSTGLASESSPSGASGPALSPPTSPRKRGFKIPGMSKLNHAIHGLMDVDPEATRRSNIGKTKEQIAQLEEALKVARADTQTASESVQTDLERFQKTKEQDLRRIMRAYVKCHVEWARKNLESWQEAKAELDKV
uniref:ARAD1A06512p n=1 Tax=Blastobotrys adeninivorans TaxID=409370 RepID=A0A060T341_BLAAD